MTKIRLKGRKGYYAFNPSDEAGKIKQKGKFSQVFKGFCYDTQLPVAIKMLNPEFANNPQKITRFKLEAAIRFDYPEIVKTIDFAASEGNYYIIQDFINGIDLHSLRKNPKLKRKTDILFYVKVIMKILRGLDHIHSQNVFHRDLKPSNIMVCYDQNDEIDFENPKVKIIDFGLAKVKDLGIKNKESKRVEFPLMYSSPEQILNFEQLIHSVSDIYSLGLTMYDLFTGRPPFYDRIPITIMHLQIATEIKNNTKIPPPLMKIIKKATAKVTFPKPPSKYSNLEIRDILIEGQKRRYQSALEMLKDLNQILQEIEKINNIKSSFFRKIWGNM